MKAISTHTINMRAFAALICKEFRHFFASSFLPKMCIGLPLVVMLVMPLVTNLDVRHVGVAVIDHDVSTCSRNLIDNITASQYTSLAYTPYEYAEALRAVERGDADVILEIPAGFQASLLSRRPLSLSLWANAVNATKGSLGMQYVQQMVMTTVAQFMPRSAPQPALQISILNYFNPTLDYRYFMIPALLIMLLVMLCGFLPALNIVGEKERGTIEQINVSPLGHFTFMLGKVIPYWIIGMFVVTLAMAIAWTVYGLVPAGSFGTIYAATFLFIIVMSSMAVFFANFSNTMQQVMLVMFFFVMIFILMSGLMTPIQSMPQWAQNATYAIPPRYYVEVMRATYLKGTPIASQWPKFAALGGFALLFSLIAVITYRKQS